jgi:hypothetical protein
MPLGNILKAKRLQGNISLTTVILVGALLIISGMAVLGNAIDVAMSTKSYFNRNIAEIRLVTCIEESMYKFTKNPNYTGTFSVTYSDGSCQATVTDIGGDPTKKNLALSATVNSFTVTRTKKADTTTSPMSITN